MDKVKSAFEKAMEKIEAMGKLSDEEKEEIKDSENLRTLLAAFYRGELTRDQLWQQMKGVKPGLLREAQLGMVNSLRLTSTTEEFRQRKDGVLAVESIKKTQNAAALENLLSAAYRIQKEYQDIKESAIDEVRRSVESNPQMRMRHVKAADGRSYPMAITVDEAIQMQLGEFLPEHEKKYEMLFMRAIERLKTELR